MNEPYLQAVDEALVCSHLGVASPADSFDEAKRKVNLLLAHAEGVGEYFARQELNALRASHKARIKAITMLRDDKFAMGFQTLAQYRKAILQELIDHE